MALLTSPLLLISDHLRLTATHSLFCFLFFLSCLVSDLNKQQLVFHCVASTSQSCVTVSGVCTFLSVCTVSVGTLWCRMDVWSGTHPAAQLLLYRRWHQMVSLAQDGNAEIRDILS